MHKRKRKKRKLRKESEKSLRKGLKKELVNARRKKNYIVPRFLKTMSLEVSYHLNKVSD